MATTSAQPMVAATPVAATPAVSPDVEVEMANHESGITPQLQNVVATVNLGTKLDLKEIAMNARNAEYNPKVLAFAVRSAGRHLVHVHMLITLHAFPAAFCCCDYAH